MHQEDFSALSKNDPLPAELQIMRDLLLHLISIALGGMTGLVQKSSKIWLMSLQNLSMIFEQSLESRKVPADWKLVNIVLIFKEDPSLLVTFQCLMKLMRRLFSEVLTNTCKTM